MEKDRPQHPPRIRTRRGVRLPAWLDRLSARVARWPWWAIIIGVGLVAAFYSLTTSDLYRRVLASVTEDPRLITDQFDNVLYDVKDNQGVTSRVSGVLTSQTADSVTVITQAEVRVSIPREDLVKQTCESPAANGDCPVNQPVSVSRRSIEGTLIFEDLGKYQIRTALGETVDVRKYTVARDQDNNLQEVRTPSTPKPCSADPEGGCSIKLALKPDAPENEIQGLLLESSPTHLLVQTVPPISVTIAKSSIVEVVNSTPAQCALNNVAACDQGVFLTLGVTVVAYIVAMVVGLIFGLMRVSSNRVLFNLSTVYVEVVRGVPLLVILLFANYVFAPWFRDNFPVYAPTLRIAIAAGGVVILAYYVLTRWSRRFTDPVDLIQPISVTVVFAIGLILVVSFFGDRSHSDLSDFQRAVLGLAFGYGAFSAELFRAGIQSIGHGQMEAARSLGMSYLQAMRFVILPQAFRVILPPLGNDFIAMLKDTSLIAFLALPELTQKARLFAAATYRPFEAYLTIAVLYLCMTLFLSFVVRVVERRSALSR